MKKKPFVSKAPRGTHILDATNQSLGRLASQIALLLQGKNKPDYVPYWDQGEIVVVKNINQIKWTGKKLKQKKYYRYSGYPGGLKIKKLEELWQKNPAEVLRKAVWQMLPKNKLRKEMIKRLKIE